MSKKSIIILGTEYSSVAKAAEVLKVSPSSLHRLIKSGDPIDLAIPNLKSLFGKKLHAKPITIKGVKYASVTAAAKSLEINKTSLLKAVKKTPNGVKLNKAVEALIANQRGSHKTQVNINETAYASFKEAGKAFGVSGGAIAYWCKQQGTTNLTIDIGEFEFSKL